MCNQIIAYLVEQKDGQDEKEEENDVLLGQQFDHGNGALEEEVPEHDGPQGPDVEKSGSVLHPLVSQMQPAEHDGHREECENGQFSAHGSRVDEGRQDNDGGQALVGYIQCPQFVLDTSPEK